MGFIQEARWPVSIPKSSKGHDFLHLYSESCVSAFLLTFLPNLTHMRVEQVGWLCCLPSQKLVSEWPEFMGCPKPRGQQPSTAGWSKTPGPQAKKEGPLPQPEGFSGSSQILWAKLRLRHEGISQPHIWGPSQIQLIP